MEAVQAVQFSRFCCLNSLAIQDCGASLTGEDEQSRKKTGIGKESEKE